MRAANKEEQTPSAESTERRAGPEGKLAKPGTGGTLRPRLVSLGPPGYGTSWVPSDLTEEPYALTRTYGSVRGAAGNGRPYRDCSLWL